MPLPKSAELFYGMTLTEEQKVYADSICDKKITFAQARPGSGKTTVALGVSKVLGKPVHYIFPTVEEGALGFTTGDEKQKEAKYLTALHDAIHAIGDKPLHAISNEKFEFMNKGNGGWIHAYSHNYMRGGNLKDCIVLIDEAQNFTRRELRKVLTRIHDSCHVVVMGDVNQCDLKNPADSGFLPAMLVYEQAPHIASVVALTKNFRGEISTLAEAI